MCTKLIIIVLLIFTTMLCWAGEKMDKDLKSIGEFPQ